MPFDATLAYAFRGAGGRQTAIEAARLLAPNDVRFERLVYAYDQLTDNDKAKIKLESLCEAAELTPTDFIRETISALWTRNVDIAKLVAAMSLPATVDAVARHAQGQFGQADRKMHMDMAGLLPTSKGIDIRIDNSKKVLNAGGASITQEGPGLPSFEERGIETIAALRGDATAALVGPQRTLPAPSESQAVTIPEPLEAVIVQP